MKFIIENRLEEEPKSHLKKQADEMKNLIRFAFWWNLIRFHTWSASAEAKKS